MTISGNMIRKQYLEYFTQNKNLPHKHVSHAPLVPPDDPSVMFTVAGMVQFKTLYSGIVDPLPYSRAATCQPCLRAGGKGSDLENVGKTLRHHTLFEMLGNFSFGDYFKEDAIRMAWDFVTNVVGLPKERLFPTIFEDDDEAEEIWKKETDAIVPPVRLGAAENFWGPAGDTGACGPCSELCFFMGSDEELKKIHDNLKNDPSKAMQTLAHRIEEEGDLFLEIWNLVFPQFDQQLDGSRLPLKNRGIDTGAGLERMTTARLWLDGLASTPYETDLLWPIVSKAAEIIGVKYVKILDDPKNEHERERLAINAIADHTRALVFALAEGITPSNNKRGYVIRRIQRRALRFASLLGFDHPFMADLVEPVIEAMGDAYPHLSKNINFIKTALKREEESFLKTRNRGMKRLDELIEKAKKSDNPTIDGKDAFELWSTYGFPYDLTLEIALDAEVAIDKEGYEKARIAHVELGRAGVAEGDFSKEAAAIDQLDKELEPTKFLGYEQTEETNCKVLAVIKDGQLVDEAEEGSNVTIVMNQSPYYAESGGQIGDVGVLTNNIGETIVEIRDTQKTEKPIFLHRGVVTGAAIKKGSTVGAAVDAYRRMKIRCNHTTTHLLQSALKRLVGDHCSQAGSFVGPDALRFDFTHSEGLNASLLKKIQEDVNKNILSDIPVSTEVMELEEAKEKGAIAPFGEKYGATVRVVEMGTDADHRVSLEFCGGTHLDRTGRAARFRILSESSIASGVRRIEAVTGTEALDQELVDQYEVVQPLQTSLAAKGSGIVDRIDQLTKRIKELEKELAKERQKAATSNLDQFIEKAIDLDGFSVVTASIDGFAGNELRNVGSTLLDKMGPKGIAVIASKNDGKMTLLAACGDEAKKSFPAGKVINAVAGKLGGKGGGKPEMAMAGAKGDADVDSVFKDIAEIISG